MGVRGPPEERLGGQHRVGDLLRRTPARRGPLLEEPQRVAVAVVEVVQPRLLQGGRQRDHQPVRRHTQLVADRHDRGGVLPLLVVEAGDLPAGPGDVRRCHHVTAGAARVGQAVSGRRVARAEEVVEDRDQDPREYAEDRERRRGEPDDGPLDRRRLEQLGDDLRGCWIHQCSPRCALGAGLDVDDEPAAGAEVARGDDDALAVAEPLQVDALARGPGLQGCLAGEPGAGRRQ